MKSFKDHQEEQRKRDNAWKDGDVEIVDDAPPRADHMRWKKGDVEVERDPDQLREDSSSGHPFSIKNAHLNGVDVEEHELSPEETDYYEKNHPGIPRDYEDVSHERRALNAYKGSSSPYNRALRHGRSVEGGGRVLEIQGGRGGDYRDHKSRMANIEGLDSLTSRRIPRDLTLYKGVDADAKFHELKPGKHFIDHGYTGASLDPRVALGFSGGYSYGHGNPENLERHSPIARIHVPAGLKGHYLDVTDDHGNSEEKEFLLHRGTLFRVNGHYTSRVMGFEQQPVHIIDVTAIDHHPRKIINPYETDAKREHHHEVLARHGFSQSEFNPNTYHHQELGTVRFQPEDQAKKMTIWSHHADTAGWNPPEAIGTGARHLDSHLRSYRNKFAVSPNPEIKS